MNDLNSEFPVPVQLTHKLVSLRLVKSTDFETLFAIASDPLVWEQHPNKDRYKEEIFRVFFNEALQSGSAYVIYDTVANQAIGSTRFYDIVTAQSHAAIGYTFLSRKYWGTAYNSIIKKLMLDYAFKYADTVFFHVGASNIRSQKAVLKLGAEKVRDFERSQNGVITFHHEYMISKNNWLKTSHS